MQGKAFDGRCALLCLPAGGAGAFVPMSAGEENDGALVLDELSRRFAAPGRDGRLRGRGMKQGFDIHDGSAAMRDEAAIQTLNDYRSELTAFREEFGGAGELPDVPFFLFGMGPRRKLLYRDGRLTDALSGTVARQWAVRSELVLPPEYSVFLTTTDGRRVSLVEDEQGVWIDEGHGRQRVDDTQGAVRLPSFREHRYPGVLRVLHQELLINVIEGKPAPNYLVYSKPWYRDSAMMALCFQATGNLEAIREWVLGLDEPFDCNNGEEEPDNLGQALFLLSLFTDRSHPLVARLLLELSRLEVQGPDGLYIRGRTDGGEHPVYQTLWAGYGLAALGLPNPYVAPRVQDSYAALFWHGDKSRYVPGRDNDNRGPFPYLGWACDHFHGNRNGPISNRDYPLTWEQGASQARYEGMNPVSAEYARQRLAAPHTWHAAEIFLYLLDPEMASQR